MNRHRSHAPRRHRAGLFPWPWAAALLFALPAPAAGRPEHTTFDLVLGQMRTDLRRQNGTDDRGLSAPMAVAIDRVHTPNHMYIADMQNGRVLGWRDASRFQSGSAADLVIGQPDAFSGQRFRTGARSVGSPAGLTVDKDGTLWVSDAANGRVLGFLWPFDPDRSSEENLSADYLLGQESFDAGYAGMSCNGAGMGDPSALPTDATLCSPAGIASDPAGNLYVADRSNHRVLLFLAPIARMGDRADAVFGQATLAEKSLCNRSMTPASPGPATLCNPQGVFVHTEGDAGRLYVADTDNNRVLVYDDPLSDQTADRVFGQSSMTSGTASVGPDRLRRPTGMVIDGSGRLWVSDGDGHRVLGFAAPFSPAGRSADWVIGQQDATMVLPNRGVQGRPVPLPWANSLWSPQAPALDGAGRLLVPDLGNHRVLLWKDLSRNDPYAAGFIGQKDYAHGGENRIKDSGLAFPVGLALDRPDPMKRPGEPIHVYVADYGNSRVLGWSDLMRMRNGRPAELVIGQGSMNDGACNMGLGVNAQTLCHPRGVAVDDNGDLWVADTWNHRVLRFPRPFEKNKSGPHTADVVLGQSSFLGGLQNRGVSTAVTPRSLRSPAAVAVGPDGMVWVADRDNDRVLGYAPPFKNGMDATKVLVGLRRNESQAGCRTDDMALRSPNGGYVCAPSGLAVDPDNNLWVADRDNNRVAMYSTELVDEFSPLISEVPRVVLGQPSAAARLSNNGTPDTPGRNSLRAPEGVSLEIQTDDKGQRRVSAIYVADTGNHRVLVYEPIQRGYQPDAVMVFGQGGAFDRRAVNTDDIYHDAPENVQQGLYHPGAVLAVPEGLFISDGGETSYAGPLTGDLRPPPSATGNHRVLIVKGPTYPEPAMPMPDLAMPEMPPPPPPPMKPGCACQAGARSATTSSLLALGVLAAMLAMCRRRQGRPER